MGHRGTVGRRGPSGGMATSAAVPTLVGWALGIAVTAAILGTPYLLFAYHDPQLHLVLDFADTGVALLVAFLIWGRYRRSGRLQDLLLAGGLCSSPVAGLGMTLGLHLLGLDDGRADVWLPVAIRVVGGSPGPRRGRGRPRAPGPRRLDTASQCPPLGDRRLRSRADLRVARIAPSSAGRHASCVCRAPGHRGTPGPARHLRRDGGLLRSGLGPLSRQGPLRAPGSRTSCSAWLGPPSRWQRSRASTTRSSRRCTATGSTPATCCARGRILLLLVGAAREISQLLVGPGPCGGARGPPPAGSRAARRRGAGARLHPRGGAYGVADPAAPRADASPPATAHSTRRAQPSTPWGASASEPLGFVLHRAARQVAERYDASLEVELDDSVHADEDQRHALVRITREAVSNAIRHGRADRVRAAADRDEQRQPTARARTTGRASTRRRSGGSATGYGLTSMEERAAALPGLVRIDSAPGTRHHRGGDVVTTCASLSPTTTRACADASAQALEAQRLRGRRRRRVSADEAVRLVSSTAPTWPCSTSTCPATASRLPGTSRRPPRRSPSSCSPSPPRTTTSSTRCAPARPATCSRTPTRRRSPTQLRGVLDGEAAMSARLVARIMDEFRAPAEASLRSTTVAAAEAERRASGRSWSCSSEGLATEEVARRLFLSADHRPRARVVRAEEAAGQGPRERLQAPARRVRPSPSSTSCVSASMSASASCSVYSSAPSST